MNTADPTTEAASPQTTALVRRNRSEIIGIAFKLVREFGAEAHALAKRNGFWESHEADWVVALMCSELGEGVNGFRKSLADDHLPQYPMVIVELADVVIRLCDAAHAYELLPSRFEMELSQHASDPWFLPAGENVEKVMKRVFMPIFRELASLKLPCSSRTVIPELVGKIIGVAQFAGWDLLPVIEAKHAFNLGRPFKHGDTI